MATSGPNLYEILGISPDATDKEIKAAYRRQARKTHPDVAGAEANGLYLLVQHAHEVLSDPARRTEYDRTMAGYSAAPNDPPPPPPEPPAGWVPGEQVPTEIYGGPLPREGHDLSAMPWLDQFDGEPSPSVRIVNAGVKRRYVLGAGIASLLTAAGLVGLIPGLALLLIIGLIGAFQIWARGSDPRPYVVPMHAMALYCLVLVGILVIGHMGGPMGVSSQMVQVLVLAAFTGAIGVLWWVCWRLAVKEPRSVPLKDLPDSFSWGNPGQGVSGAAHIFGLGNTMDGVEGERLTAAEIGYFLGAIPGVRLINGLMFPGSRAADVDHAVICGNKVALIDSKAWKPATYALVAGQDAIRVGSGQNWDYFPAHMPTAVEEYRKILTRRRPDVEVRGYIVVHPKNLDDPLELHNDSPDSLVRLVTATELIETLGIWFTEDGNQALAVDRESISRLVCSMK